MKELPVIMLIAHSGKEVGRAFIVAGANDYLVKPVEFKRLLKRVADRLKIHDKGSQTLHPYFFP
jgi:DNA-binding response OmpR family regulator